jgi:hypothetical protein
MRALSVGFVGFLVGFVWDRAKADCKLSGNERGWNSISMTRRWEGVWAGEEA